MNNIYLNENIKRLRKERDITQETLADFLGISFQSVSKWERNESLPDITLVPAIANYFGVTIDELMGNDKIKAEEQILKYINEAEKAGMSSETEDMFMIIAKKAYKEYPYDYRIIKLYVKAMAIYNKSKEEYERYKPEIKRLCELILEGCTNDAIRYFALNIRGDAGETPEERMKYYGRFPQSYGDCIDEYIDCCYSPETEKGFIQRQKNLMELWWRLNDKIYGIGNLKQEFKNYSVDSETKIKLIKKCETILYALFDSEDDLGEYLFYAGQYNEFLTIEYLKIRETDRALDCFEKAVDGWIAYNSLPDYYEYKSVLMNHLVFDRKKIFTGGKYPTYERYVRDIDSNSLYNLIRDKPRFKTAYNKLKT